MEKKRREMGKKDQGIGGQDREIDNGDRVDRDLQKKI